MKNRWLDKLFSAEDVENDTGAPLGTSLNHLVHLRRLLVDLTTSQTNPAAESDLVVDFGHMAP